MFGYIREKRVVNSKVDSGLRPSSKRSTGEPYLYLSSATSSVAPLRKSSGTSAFTPIKAASSRAIHPQTPSKSSANSNNNPEKPKAEVIKSKPIKKSNSHPKRKSTKIHLSKSTSGKSITPSSANSPSNQSQSVVEREPFDSKISKDIAKAVALIVAEYETLKNNNEEEADSQSSARSEAPADNPDSDSKTREVEEDTSNLNSNNNPPPNGAVVAAESKPGTASSAVVEPVQSSQLPELKKKKEKRESNATAAQQETPSPAQKPTLPTPPRSNALVPAPTREAKMGGQSEVKRYIARVQNYINTLGYHREGEPETSINVRLSMKTHMLTAKDLIQAGRQIKCLHAVVLSVYLTNSLDTVERFPIYFRSHVGEKEYKHIVLGIYCQGHFGALGISRDVGLQDKKLVYTRLSDLIFEFAKCYKASGHILNEIKLGTIITHDQSSLEKLFSKIGTVPIHDHYKADIEANVERIAKQLRAKMGLACLKSICCDRHISPNARRSRSKLSLRGTGSRTGVSANPNNSANVSLTSSSNTTSALRTRANSLGPNVPPIGNSSDDKLTSNQKNSKSSIRSRTKAAKVKRKQ